MYYFMHLLQCFKNNFIEVLLMYYKLHSLKSLHFGDF